MNLFLDTSAVVKLYHHEDGTDNLLNFLIQYSTDLILTISDLTPIEFRSAFLKRVRMDEIELDIGKQVFLDFEKDMELMNVVETNQLKTAQCNCLVVFFIHKQKKAALPISARDMSISERRYYEQKR